MTLEITKTVNISDLEDIFGSAIPSCHPADYINSRMRDQTIFLAQQNGHNTGFLIYSIWWGNCPFIELIKVKPEFQRQKIGYSLLQSAAAELKAKNFKQLISSSEVVNDNGQSFHKKWGFEELNILSLPHGEEQFFTINLETFL